MNSMKRSREPDPEQPNGQRVQWLHGPLGVALAVFWGLGEATFFFVVPDVLISLVALLRPARAWRHVLAALAGAALGGLLLYSWSARNPAKAQTFVAHVPFVRMRMLAGVHSSYAKRGAGAVFLGPLATTPYKIYAVEAPEFLSRNKFVLATFPARAERFLAVWAAFAFAGHQLRKRFGFGDKRLLAIHACFWICLYGFYWGNIVLH